MEKLRYIIYCRKSTDSEDRQVQSIEDQKREINFVVQQRGLNVIKVFEESQSAKQPGRPLFNEMMNVIQSGKADGIIAWKLNRLARNPIDGAAIQWPLQQGMIKSIITPSREYLPTDNVLMMAVELGMANQFILDLRKDVKRGLKNKAEKGWRPTRAPLGYLNDKRGLQGDRKIFTDLEKFSLVRKAWDYILTGNYTIPQLVKIINESWGLTSVGEKRLANSSLYAVLTNPFYYGEFSYDGELYQGKHEKMITPEEYDQAQKILGKTGKPRSKYKRLPFCGIIKCSECGGMITAEEKIKLIKSTDETKKYIYHHCSRRRKDRHCTQKSITHNDLVDQIKRHLDSITLPEEFLEWSVSVLKDYNLVEEHDRNKIIKNQQKNYKACIKRIDNLINLYISPDNSDKELLSEDEFKNQKNALLEEKTKLLSELNKTETRVDEWIELTTKTFEFAVYAKHWFEQGNYEVKSNILRSFGQNFVLKDGILNIEINKPLLAIKRNLETKPITLSELKFFHQAKRKNSPIRTEFSRWSG